jgi:hypothetical protein
LISLVLVSCVFAVVFLAWYPQPAFEVVGAFPVIRMLVVVHLLIGPLLTMVVYKQGKPGLKFDLAFIVLVQIAALIYGAHRLHAERPQYLVFAVDRVEYVSDEGIDTSEIRFAELRDRPLTKLVNVFARRPEDAGEFQRYLDSVMTEGKPDLERRPEFWEPWSAGAEEIRKAVRPIGKIVTADPHEKKTLNQALNDYGSEYPNLGVLPIGGVQEDFGLLVDRETLEVLGAIRVNPWGQSLNNEE